MTQKIIKVGTSAAVVIPKEILKKFSLKPGLQVEVSADDNQITILPPVKQTRISKTDREIIKTALNLMKRYKKDFAVLAEK